MSFAANIPHFYSLLRAEYIYDLQSHQGEYIPCCVFAVDSVSGHAIGFDCMTDFGAQFARLPVSAFCWKEDAPRYSLETLELWNSFSYSVEAIEYEYLHQMRCDVRLPGTSHTWTSGIYMFTLSWYGSRYAEDPGAGGFKRAHIIKLDNGNYAAQPNNRLRFYEPSFITKSFSEKPDFKTNSHIWNVENKGQWRTEDSDRFFYDLKEGNNE